LRRAREAAAAAERVQEESDRALAATRDELESTRLKVAYLDTQRAAWSEERRVRPA